MFLHASRDLGIEVLCLYK